MKLKSTKRFKIRSLGKREQYVYDIEVEDNHNFFANDILVHNSLYLNFKHLYDKISEKIKDEQRVVDYLSAFCKKVIEPIIDNGYKKLAEYVNAPENRMFMKREVIAKCFHPNSIITDIGMSMEDLYNSTQEQSFVYGDTETKHINMGIRSYNDKTNEIEDDTLYAISRKKYKGYMYKFEEGDNILEVTEDHLLPVRINKGGVEWKKAKYIKEDDELIFDTKN